MKITVIDNNLSTGASDASHVPPEVVVTREVLKARRIFNGIIKRLSPIFWPVGVEPTELDVIAVKIEFAENIVFELGQKGYQVEKSDIQNHLFINIRSDFKDRSSEWRLIPVVKDLEKLHLVGL